MSKRSKRSSPPPTLNEVLSARSANSAPAAHWSEADRALLSEDYASAASSYAAAADTSPVERAKHGFCLGMQGDDDGAEALLSESNVGEHPEAQAVLAWVLGGSRGRRIRGLGDAQTMHRMAERKARVDALFKLALSHDRPSLFVFYALFHVLGTYHEDAGPQAARARMLYPDWAWPHAIVAGKQRVSGNLDPGALEDLMRTLPSARHEDVFHEAYVHAMQLERWDDAERVIEALERLVSQDAQVGDRNLASLSEMRAMLSLHRARAGETDAYETVLDQLAAFVPAVAHVVDGRDPTVAPKFLLQVALEFGQEDRLRDAATALVARAWDTHGERYEDLDTWGPYVASPSLEGVLQFGHFGFDFTSRWREVEAQLGGAVRERWSLMLAADAVLHRDPEPDQVKLLCATPVQGLPWWISRAIFEAHAIHAEDPIGAGAVLAELAELAAGIPPAEDDRFPAPLESLSVDVESLENPIALFTGALDWLYATPTATGQALLEQWGMDLAEVDGGKAVLSHLAALSLSRVDSAIAHEMMDLAEIADTPETRLTAALARYPQPESTRVRAEDLSLLEAATLIALLRASPLDHVRWTLAPLDISGQSFEPTHKFIGTLFGLMNKGVLAIDASTPAGVVKVEDDGRLTAYLSRVVWRISANTLALQRAIRDLPRGQWPEAWRDHATTLARDLGVEELVTYLDHLVTDRNLPTPNMDDARGLFRIQLEHLSIAQCYYLAHKTMRETLDYQARHRPGRAQLEARIINLLRGNGERAIAKGWDTRYDRIRELPPSLLWEALHDVLTRWGRTAFEEPVMTLTLEDPETPPTHH
ncbi:hypothetical protein [Solilutibacter silvestris]|uniref:Uncharacterized protein n=1 Tax=Solilutibacter silvestris TaxID=1645665 RepID=A0A2K1Q247_9GAMM|nr:hypothetical protein [Lysobacter silvestris]PNS09103.1 hypothetical protein Lysil_0732 [Lysobacter silvestris]